MNKFGLFDILSKLQNNDKQNDLLQNLLSSFLNTKTQKNQESNVKKDESPNITEPPPYFKSQAILNVIKKHDLLSMQIDNDNKKR